MPGSRRESPPTNEQASERASEIKLDATWYARRSAKQRVLLYKVYKEPLSPRRIARRLLPRRHQIPVPFPKSLSAVDPPPPASPSCESIYSSLLRRRARSPVSFPLSSSDAPRDKDGAEMREGDTDKFTRCDACVESRAVRTYCSEMRLLQAFHATCPLPMCERAAVGRCSSRSTDREISLVSSSP